MLFKIAYIICYLMWPVNYNFFPLSPIYAEEFWDPGLNIKPAEQAHLLLLYLIIVSKIKLSTEQLQLIRRKC